MGSEKRQIRFNFGPTTYSLLMTLDETVRTSGHASVSILTALYKRIFSWAQCHPEYRLCSLAFLAANSLFVSNMTNSVQFKWTCPMSNSWELSWKASRYTLCPLSLTLSWILLPKHGHQPEQWGCGCTQQVTEGGTGRSLCFWILGAEPLYAIQTPDKQLCTFTW